MDIQVNGKQIDIGEALTGHVIDRLGDAVGKYFDHAVDGHVTFAPEAHFIKVDCAVHLGQGMRLQSHGEGNDAHAAFDQALSHMEKRLRRYKRRLRDHHADERAQFEMAQATSYVLQSEDEAEAEPEGLQPVIIAEMQTDIPTTSVGAAVMRMDLADAPVLMFRNAANGELNVVYRRADGNVGWIDPAAGDAKGK